MIGTKRESRVWTDHDTETIIGNLLRIGVILSASVVFVGGLLYLIHFGGTIPNHSAFHGEPKELTSIHGILACGLKGNPRGIIATGLLLLIATPIARVVFSIWAFVRERDWLYVVITLVVLGVLTYSLMQG